MAMARQRDARSNEKKIVTYVHTCCVYSCSSSTSFYRQKNLSWSCQRERNNKTSTRFLSVRIMAYSVGSEQDFVEIWLGSHEDFARRFVESWLRDHPDEAKKLSIGLNYCPSTHIMSNSFGVNFPESRILKHYISSPNLPNQRRRKSTTELRKLDKHHLFVELLADVVSPNFDVNYLSHKILVNVLVLTNADRSSLFLVEGPEDNPILVSRLFDVTEETSVEEAVHDESEAIKMPVGMGIAGSVAKTGDTINLQNAYQVSQFSKSC